MTKADPLEVNPVQVDTQGQAHILVFSVLTSLVSCSWALSYFAIPFFRSL